jgi:hypothetical protein
MSNTIYDEIIDKFSDYFIEEEYPEEFVKDNPELFQEDGTLRDITKIIISSIFSMRFEVKTHSVYLEYFI